MPPSYFTENFPVPSNVVTAEIDPDTGLLAGSSCPRRMTEVFIEGTAPTMECRRHDFYFDDLSPEETPAANPLW